MRQRLVDDASALPAVEKIESLAVLKLEELANSQSALISHTDASQTVRFVNSKHEAFFGAAPNSLIGQTALQTMGAAAYEDHEAELPPYWPGNAKALNASHTATAAMRI